MIEAKLIEKSKLFISENSVLFKWEIHNIEPNTEEIIQLILFTDDEIKEINKTYQKLSKLRYNNGKILNFEVLTENDIWLDYVELYTDVNLSFNKLLLKYIDIKPYEKVSDDSLNKYYSNKDEFHDMSFYLKIKNKDIINSGKITIGLVLIPLTKY